MRILIYHFFCKWYIMHEDAQNPENGWAIFGPFRGFEINKRANDAHADLLAGSGPLNVELLPKDYLKTVHVNPRRYWMKQLRDISRRR